MQFQVATISLAALVASTYALPASSGLQLPTSCTVQDALACVEAIGTSVEGCANAIAARGVNVFADLECIVNAGSDVETIPACKTCIPLPL